MIGMLVAFAGMIAAGAALGIVAIVSVGVRREQKAARRLSPDSPGPLTSGARAVTGLGVYRASAT
jgi:hypothetical protein